MGKGANQPGRGTCSRKSETIEAQSVADAIGEPTLRGTITSGDHSPDAGPDIRNGSAGALTQDRPCAAGAQSFWRRGRHLALGGHLELGGSFWRWSTVSLGTGLATPGRTRSRFPHCPVANSPNRSNLPRENSNRANMTDMDSNQRSSPAFRQRFPRSQVSGSQAKERILSKPRIFATFFPEAAKNMRFGQPAAHEDSADMRAPSSLFLLPLSEGEARNGIKAAPSRRVALGPLRRNGPTRNGLKSRPSSRRVALGPAARQQGNAQRAGKPRSLLRGNGPTRRQAWEPPSPPVLEAG